MSFVKLHGKILDSSIWLESPTTRLVWITMLCLADENGVVEASVGGLAHRSRVDRADCEAALAILSGPDPDSRDGTSGERIEKTPGGWLILNHANYRDRTTTAQIRTAERVRLHRQRRSAEIQRIATVENDSTQGVTRNDVTDYLPISPSEAEAEAEAYTEAEEDKKSVTRKRAPLPAGYPKVIAAFDAAYKAQTGHAPTWGARQGRQIKGLLASHSADEVIRRIGILFGPGAPGWLSPPHDLGTLVQHFDKLVTPTAARADRRVGRAEPARPHEYQDGIIEF